VPVRFNEILTWEKISEDVRNWAVTMIMTAALAMVVAIALAVWKAFKQQPVPWTVLGVLIAISIGLLVFAIILLKTRPQVSRGGPASSGVRFEGGLNAQRKSGPSRRVATEAIRIAREDKINFTLYALQNAGVGNLDTEDEFQAAREIVIQSNLPDPIKDLSVSEYGLTWLALIQYANKKQKDLYNSAAVYDCIKAYFTERNLPSTAKHKISVSCGKLVEKSVVTAGGETWYRARLDLQGSDPVRDIEAIVTDLWEDEIKVQLQENLTLTMHPGMIDRYPVDKNLQTLRAGTPEFVDVIRVGDNIAHFPLKFYPRAVDHGKLLTPAHTYQMTVVIHSQSDTPLICTFEFEWTGDTQTSDIRLISIRLHS